MPERFLTLSDGLPVSQEAKDSSAGAADAGKIPALNDEGKIPDSMMPDGVGADVAAIAASENLAAGDLVNLWSDGGTIKARKADATAAGKEADGFVKEAVTASATADVYLDGTITGLTGLTVGANYFLSTTGGAATATAPSTNGNMVQLVGKAKSATELIFERNQAYELTGS